jgi:tetratricopeptide (TPR) repeat protein
MTRDDVWRAAQAAWARGDPAAAAAACESLLKAYPLDLEARNLLGVACFLTGRPEAAAEHLSQVASKLPGNAQVQAHLGSALGAAGRPAEALTAFGRALALGLKDPAVLFNQALALAALERWGEALASLDRAEALAPPQAEALVARGDALAGLGRRDEALSAYDAAIAMKPGHVNAHNNSGVLLAAMGRPEDAIARYDRALALDPRSARAYANRSAARLALKHPVEALADGDRAVQLAPDFPEAHNNRGRALADLQRIDEALAAYDRAIELRPGFADAIGNRGLLRLLAGEFARGWPDYEHRWRSSDGPAVRWAEHPRWTGEAPLAGKTVLLHAEQGYGDAIQFARYADLVRRRGARLLLEVPAPLAPLMRRLDPAVEILVRDEPPPPFDLQCPLLSLPSAFGTDLESIPWSGPYLSAGPERARTWRERLGPGGQPRIGLVWSGNPHHNNDRNRSLPAALAARLCMPGLQVVCLQTQFRDGDVERLEQAAGAGWFHAPLADFADTAALLDACDLVISVDTSVAHLAGAMGKPVWILLPFAPDWRWMLGRGDSPWYPSARLWRQPAPGDWDRVIDQAAEALALRFGR